MAESNKDMITKFWNAVKKRDWEMFESLLHKDIVYDLPQTREKIRGCGNFREFNATFPGDWTIEIVRLTADDIQATSQIAFHDNDGTQTGISFFEFKDGLVYRITEFWPTPYDPPVRELSCIERY